MKNKILILLISWIISFNYLSAQNIQLDSLDIFINQLMEDFDVPGLSIGIVQNDSIIYLKGFGTREISTDNTANENTLFGIGSITKSFTALTLGILVDEGKIKWDDKVVTYLPYFELYDPYVTANFTIRDLLTHRSGLKRVSGGTLWYHSDLSRLEIIKNFKYLEPVSGFREKPAYQNIMYMAAGEIVREVTGQEWDNFLKDRVFNKLGMRYSTSISSVREASKNLALPHIWNESYDRVSIEQEKMDNLAAAGSIYSSANEMTSYMRLLLNDGIFKQDTIVSKKVINEIFKPQIIYPIGGAPFYNEFTSYGFGWWLTPKNGHKVIEHGGGIDGMSAHLFMVKDLNIGVLILTNSSREPSIYLLSAKLKEMIFNDASFDIYDRLKVYRDKRLESYKNTANQKKKIDGTQASLDTKFYTGVYSDKMYGKISIKQLKEKELEIEFTHSPVFKGKLKHWHFDTYQIDWHDIRVPNGYLTFKFNSEREIIGFDIDQDNLLDVDFGELNVKRLKEDNPIEPVVVDDKILESYVGKYELTTDLIFTITKNGNQLKAQLTGQSKILIFARSNTVFNFKDIEAQLIFNSNDDGKVESVTLLQGGQKMVSKRMKD
ncbi:MAG: serine hydrolase [Bacteroidales bacterium]|nr:serine hydrolase [Bacteroidales bacterium]